MLEARGLTKRWRRGQKSFEAVANAGFKLADGEFAVVVGRSGSGKTTLLNMLVGLLSPDDGEVFIDEVGLWSLDDGALSRLRNERIGYVPQGRSLLGSLTVLDNVRLPFHLAPRGGGSRARALELLDELGLGPMSDNYPADLSGGELRRATLARALINSPKFLVADEPTSDLDLATAREIVELLKNLNAQGLTVLAATHDEEMRAGAGRVMEMAGGELRDV
ncbi:MAG: ATP-binding cassette domain-containing protein [Deltaproteobacteria bacterium]|nr:ATP-binding cassette domain-containing protein [Deltaproteobacteria bacterium]